MEKVYLVIKSDSGDYYVTTYEILGTYRNSSNANAYADTLKEKYKKNTDIEIIVKELILND